MTVSMPPKQVAASLEGDLASAVVEVQDNALIIKSEKLVEIAAGIKNTKGLEFDYLSSITGIDYPDYFELNYLFYSLRLNHRLTLKVRCLDKASPIIPSISGFWKGAFLQECEIYDLLGIHFTGHSGLKRIFMWEGFKGYPLRKDYSNDV